jgi:transposase-like protein
MSNESTCLHCGSVECQVKSGRTRRGSQRYLCRLCNRHYTPSPLPLGYSEATRREAVLLYLEGTNLHRIGRLLEVSPQSAANWVNAYRANLPAVSPAPDATQTLETDELFTFFNSKKRQLTS